MSLKQNKKKKSNVCLQKRYGQMNQLVNIKFYRWNISKAKKGRKEKKTQQRKTQINSDDENYQQKL